MKLWGVAMIRNEADIVEAFVRHNLTILDGLVVVDHGSTDATMDILKALHSEGLRLTMLRNDAPGYLQAEITTTAARHAFARGGADAVIPLDADEFLKVPSRSALERAIAMIPAAHFASIAWRTYVPPLADAHADMVALIRASRRIAVEPEHPPEVRHKVLLTRDFAADPTANIVMGNHGVVLGNHVVLSPRMPQVELPAVMITVCHLPVRSAPQFIVKITIKRLARLAAARDYPPGSNVRRAWDAICRGEPLTSARMLQNHVAGHLMPEDVLAADMAATVDDPFIADIHLRYTAPAPTDPLPLVLTAVERLARRLGPSAARSG